MSEFFRHPLSQSALWFALIFALMAVLIAAMRRLSGQALERWRGSDDGDQQEASRLLSKYRELHARGGLSDDEYRTIKTKLAAQLQAEASDSDQSS